KLPGKEPQLLKKKKKKIQNHKVAFAAVLACDAGPWLEPLAPHLSEASILYQWQESPGVTDSGAGSRARQDAARRVAGAGVPATLERASVGEAGGRSVPFALGSRFLGLGVACVRQAVWLPVDESIHDHWKRSTGLLSPLYLKRDPRQRAGEGSRKKGLWHDRGGEDLHTTADLDQKPSSSHSGHSSEMSLPQVQKDKYPEEFSLLKLQTKDGHRPEWTFYPRFSSNIHTYHVGKQCFFNGVFLGNKRSLSERTVDKCFGKKKYDIDPRNGIPKLTPGDNPYMYPEQSKGFHKAGSTLPPVNFSVAPYEKKFDTFIPLEPLPQIPNLPFWVKEKANSLKNEIQEVEELNNWQPAVPLILLLPGRRNHE
uniref:Spermatosis associated serine rich 1 n=1 Tax=Macaca mulatta TaxID=9544 RepID=A0A5F7ZLN5_MACMU